VDAKIVMKMNRAIYGRTVSAVPKHRLRRLVMSFEMVRLDRASSEPRAKSLINHSDVAVRALAVQTLREI
jgi:hypothetical protein